MQAGISETEPSHSALNSMYCELKCNLFLSRDAMRKRYLCCGPVSVRLSVTFVPSIHTAEDIVKLLCRLGSPIILVFFYSGADTQFQMAQNTGVGKFCDFRLKSQSMSERYEIGPWLL